jgi:outer membrane protein assembly factor BamE (lipoprotein component of BamABCDE complex)
MAMKLVRVLFCLCVCFLICRISLAQQVTETKWVDSGKDRQLLRKINGRWWTQDNREVYPPSKGGVFWEVDSNPGVVQFFHHRPLQLARAENLRLWMTKQEVEATLGPPNRVFGRDDHANWYYYAADGTKLDVRFVDDGVLGEAKYYAIGEKSRSVASIEHEMNGRSIYFLVQERATKRSHEWLAKKTEENRQDQAARSEALRRSRSLTAQPRVVTVEADASRQSVPDHPAPKRTITAAALSNVQPGSTRQDVLSRLGEPAFRSSITGDEGTQEFLTYDLDTGEEITIRLVDGKVVKVR